MAEAGRRVVDVAPGAIAKIIAAVALVWLWLQLWRLLMIIIIAVILAITLDPVVEWLERRRMPRGLGATLLVLALAALVAAFVWFAGTSLAHQARMLGDRLQDFWQETMRRLPSWVSDTIRNREVQSSGDSDVAGYVVTLGSMVLSAMLVAVLALIMTIYLLIDGRRTYRWLVAYAPRSRRERVHVTAQEARKAIFAYAIGNVVTSVFATVFALIVLSILNVPAPLLLALLAGLCDFIPVLGFILSSVPAILLALTVSPTVAVVVALLYAGYHVAENYYIGPKIYGDRLRLSDLAVIVAFAVGAQIGGIMGALIALPLAALYPVIENVWLKDYLGRETTDAHRRIENSNA